MKLVLKILALPVLFVVKVICILGNLLTNVVSYVIGLLLLVIGGSAIYCIVKALWQSLLILVVGQRIRAARLEKGYSQADLGALVGCSNNHMSHVEVGQTKVSLAMLLKLAFVLEKNFDYFLLDTPYAKCDSIIDNEIAAKLKKCNVTTLITVGKLIDVLIDQQEMIKKAELD